ncbi:MAG: hypothetical protein IT441_03670 [Phycisphaeraceae bacterium]|nr:hypothetical protein [Phycisphaeraceae bacterium]
MPIRFRCQSCQAKIRVPEGSEGRKVKCPRCGLIQNVPQRAHAAEPVAEEVKLAAGAESAGLANVGSEVQEQAHSTETPETSFEVEEPVAVTHLRLVHAPEPEPEPSEPELHQTAQEPEAQQPEAEEPRTSIVVHASQAVEGYPSDEPSLFSQAPAEGPDLSEQAIETPSPAEEFQAVTAAMSEPTQEMAGPREDESADEDEIDEPATAYSVSASDAQPVQDEPSRADEITAEETSAARRLADAVKTVRATATKVRALPMNGSPPAQETPTPVEEVRASEPRESLAEELEPTEPPSRRARIRAMMGQIVTMATGSRREAEDTIEETDLAAVNEAVPGEAAAVESPEPSAFDPAADEAAGDAEPNPAALSTTLASWRAALGRLPAAGGYYLMGALIWFFRGASLLYAGAAIRAVVEAYRHGYAVGGILDVSLGGLVRVLMILSLAEALRAMRQVAINTHGGNVVTTAPAPGSDTPGSRRHAAMRPKLVAMRSDRGIAPGSAYRRMRQAALR